MPTVGQTHRVQQVVPHNAQCHTYPRQPRTRRGSIASNGEISCNRVHYSLAQLPAAACRPVIAPARWYAPSLPARARCRRHTAAAARPRVFIAEKGERGPSELSSNLATSNLATCGNVPHEERTARGGHVAHADEHREEGLALARVQPGREDFVAALDAFGKRRLAELGQRDWRRGSRGWRGGRHALGTAQLC
eukprot:scaffold75887_cov63-Phaeocystis_antarctica.AAC.4